MLFTFLSSFREEDTKQTNGPENWSEPPAHGSPGEDTVEDCVPWQNDKPFKWNLNAEETWEQAYVDQWEQSASLTRKQGDWLQLPDNLYNRIILDLWMADRFLV